MVVQPVISTISDLKPLKVSCIKNNYIFVCDSETEIGCTWTGWHGRQRFQQVIYQYKYYSSISNHLKNTNHHLACFSQ